MVAVPAVVAYNFFLRKVNSIMTDIEAVSKKTGVLLHSELDQRERVNGHHSLPEQVLEVQE
jgi:biopolymer transport protein ExbB/TolQ